MFTSVTGRRKRLVVQGRDGGSACESNTPLPLRTTAGFEDREDHRILSASSESPFFAQAD
jgi:hypothetical protein